VAVATDEELASVRDRLFGQVREDQIRQVTVDRPDPAVIAAFLAAGQRVCGPAITIRYARHGGDVSGVLQRGERSGLGDRDMYAVTGRRAPRKPTWRPR
jgi:hypothetical protein